MANSSSIHPTKGVASGRGRIASFFLDTIFRGYPCPAIFLHKVMDERGERGLHRYNVVDGKQRLQRILMFAEDKISVSKEFGDIRLDGKKWSELAGEQQLRRRFWDYVLPVEFIDLPDDASMNQAFDRLNRNSRKLERQELRHAQFDGWLTTFAEAESEKEEWKRLGVVTTSAYIKGANLIGL